MQFLTVFALLGIIGLMAARGTVGEENVEPNILIDDVDAGDLHSNDVERQVRHWGGGWGGGWGGPWYGGGWAGSRWGGGWGSPRWGGGYGRPRWGGWGGYYWG